jgi:hypothetical protein
VPNNKFKKVSKFLKLIRDPNYLRVS